VEEEVEESAAPEAEGDEGSTGDGDSEDSA
jgi:hypothetical protein